MRVLLINPPYGGKTIERRGRCTRLDPHGWVHPPLHLMYLSSVLKQRKAKVKLVDAIIDKLSIDDVVEEAVKFKPDFIISWAGSFSFEVDIVVLEKIKEKLPKVKNFLAGTDIVAAKPELFLDKKFIDFVISGEAELAVNDIVSFFEGKISKGKIRNITYSEKGKIKRNKHEIIQDIDSIPFPDRDIVDNHKYKGFPFFSDNFTDILTSRGCPYNCIFCTSKAYWGSKYRGRSAENIFAEIEECVNKYGIKSFFVLDESFSVEREKVLKLCKLIRESGLKIKWGCQTRVDLVDEELIKEMASAGCSYLHYGVESGSQRILNYLKKGITVKQIKDAFKWTRKYGIESCATLIVGTPEDKPEDLKMTLDLYKEIKPDYVHVSPLIPIVGSPVFYELEKNNMLKTKDFTKYVKPNIIFKAKYLTDEEIVESYKKAWRIMSLDIGYVLRHINRAIKKRDVRFFVEALKAGFWISATFFRKGSEE